MNGISKGEGIGLGIVQQLERWFLRRGIPHFIDGYSAREHVLTRAVPLLTLVFLGEVAGALNLDWSWWQNVLAIVAAFAICAAAWAVSNRLRHRRTFARPDDIGLGELAVFVIVPPLLPLIFGEQIRSALVTAASNVLLIAVIYLTTSFGLVSMLRWAIERFARQIESVVRLLARALPLMMLFVAFLFLTTEVWQIAVDQTAVTMTLVVALFVIVGTIFVVTRLPGEIQDLGRFSSWDEVCAITVDTPAHELDRPSAHEPIPSAPLGRREYGNTMLLLVFSQGLQIVVVGTMIGLFCLVFGVLTVSPDTTRAWTGAPQHAFVEFTLDGRDFVITAVLLKVSGFLAAVTGLYFAVVALTDPLYRKEFFDDVTAEVRVALAVRLRYLAHVRPAREEANAPEPPTASVHGSNK